MVYGERARRVVGAAVEPLVAAFGGLAGLTFDKVAAALGALHADALKQRLRLLAVRESAAREEAPEAARLDDHGLAALFAYLIGFFVDLVARNSFGFLQRALDRLVERGVELLQHRRPLSCAARNLV